MVGRKEREYETHAHIRGKFLKNYITLDRFPCNTFSGLKYAGTQTLQYGRDIFLTCHENDKLNNYANFKMLMPINFLLFSHFSSI
jgi:hypothetical protein